MSPAEMVARSRADQGLPERVEDPSTLAAVATLLDNEATPALEAGAADAASGSGRGVRRV